MGNNQSQQSIKKNNLFEVVNNIATNYILTQNFKDMQNLVSDLEYCDNLVILTSKIIQEKVHMKDITFMQQKLKAGVPIDKLANDKIAYFEKPLEKYDVKNTTNKRRMCIGIAKFYIQIANLFSAITMTLNPIFIYKDETGNEVEVPLSEKDKIPKGVDVKVINNNLCQKRIDILMNNNEKYNDKNSTINLNLDDEYIINPNFCNMNLSSSGNIKNMKKMAGIPELRSLYNDVYDYDTGSFKNMSPEMEQEYNKDLITFYKAFTGESKFPVDPDTQQSAIKSFRDIKLRNYALLSGCKNGNYKQEFTGNLRDSLFIKYANNIKNMIQSTETNQNSLIEILDQVFSVTKNKETGAEMFTINPSLNQTKLNALVKDAKNKIMNLYINCEKQFSEGINIYEAISRSTISTRISRSTTSTRSSRSTISTRISRSTTSTRSSRDTTSTSTRSSRDTTSTRSSRTTTTTRSSRVTTSTSTRSSRTTTSTRSSRTTTSTSTRSSRSTTSTRSSRTTTSTRSSRATTSTRSSTRSSLQKKGGKRRTKKNRQIKKKRKSKKK
jgi:hypothetical protein